MNTGRVGFFNKVETGKWGPNKTGPSGNVPSKKKCKLPVSSATTSMLFALDSSVSNNASFFPCGARPIEVNDESKVNNGHDLITSGNWDFGVMRV